MNPFAAKPACEVCDDARIVTTNVKASRDAGHLIPCPRCGAEPHPGGPESPASAERHEHFRREVWKQRQAPPTISQLDLTPEELTAYRQLREDHPKVSSMTVLTWIEGRRYDPSKDPEFLAEAREAFKVWRAR